MRSSFDEALITLQELSAMSAQRPPDPLGDRPRMAEALASLKEGLRDTADPLYDGWKRRPRAASVDPSSPPASIESASSAEAPAPPPVVARIKPQPPENPGITIDLSLDGTPDETPIGELDVPIDEEFGDPSEATENAFFSAGQSNEMGSTPPVVAHPSSVQVDTVRVRVIRYPAFPRWALVVAAALVVFAASIVALRPAVDDDEPDIAVNDTAPASTVALSPHAAAAQIPTVPAAAAALVVAAPASSSMPSGLAEEQHGAGSDVAPPSNVVEKEARPSVESVPARPVVGRPPVAPAAAGAQGKIPAASGRRRSSSRDFFRDPGF
jgi:hypothetical protein